MKKMILLTLLMLLPLTASTTPTIKAEEPEEPQQTISDLEFTELTGLPDYVTGFGSREIALSENFDEFTLELPDTFYLTDNYGGIDSKIFFRDEDGETIRTQRFDPRRDNLSFSYDSEVEHISIRVMVTYGDNPPGGGNFPEYLNDNSAIQLGEAWQIRFYAFDDYLGSRGFINSPSRTSIGDFDVDYPEDENYTFNRWIDSETGEQVVWNKEYNRDIEAYAAFTTGYDHPDDFFVPGIPGDAPDASDDAMMDNLIAVMNNYGFGDEIGMAIFYLITLLVLNMVVIGANLGGAASIVITLGTTAVFMLTGLVAWWIAIFIFLAVGLTMIAMKGRMQYD